MLGSLLPAGWEQGLNLQTEGDSSEQIGDQKESPSLRNSFWQLPSSWAMGFPLESPLSLSTLNWSEPFRLSCSLTFLRFA